MSRSDRELPARLLNQLAAGTPALLLTVGADGFPHSAFTWALATGAARVLFGADVGSVTIANLEREGRAALQICGPANLVFIVKGVVSQLKERLAAAPIPIALMALDVTQAKDQAWPQATVAPLAYEWNGEVRAEMEATERAVYAEMREYGLF